MTKDRIITGSIFSISFLIIVAFAGWLYGFFYPRIISNIDTYYPEFGWGRIEVSIWKNGDIIYYDNSTKYTPLKKEQSREIAISTAKDFLKKYEN